jgi:flagellar basal-body rod protein FlgF
MVGAPRVEIAQMENAGFIGLSRQVALEHAMDVVAQNVANINTTGYKGEHIRFREFIETTDPTAKIGRTMDFVIDQGMVRDLKDGAMQKTGNTYDVAIAGNGFFPIRTADGTQYTRNGNFTVNNNSQLVTSEGRAVLGDNDQPITIPANAGEVVIAGDGTISSGTARIGKIKVVTFNQPQNLDRRSDGLYVAHDSDPARTVARPNIIQGVLEASNVQPVMEITKKISVQRAYEGAKTLVDTVSQISADATRRLGQRAA